MPRKSPSGYTDVATVKVQNRLLDALLEMGMVQIQPTAQLRRLTAGSGTSSRTGGGSSSSRTTQQRSTQQRTTASRNAPVASATQMTPAPTRRKAAPKRRAASRAPVAAPQVILQPAPVQRRATGGAQRRQGSTGNRGQQRQR